MSALSAALSAAALTEALAALLRAASGIGELSLLARADVALPAVALVVGGKYVWPLAGENKGRGAAAEIILSKDVIVES